MSGYTYSTTGCCVDQCTTCFGPIYYNCLSCPGGTYLLSQICVNPCPLGYSLSSVCVLTKNPFLALTLNQIQNPISDSVSGISFSTGTASNPIPAMNRGYYFNLNSFMTSDSFILPYNFTIILYIKHMISGTLLTKNSISIGTSASLSFTITSLITNTFSTLPSNNWNVLVFTLFTT